MYRRFNIVSIDVGTTRVKVVKYKQEVLYYEEYERNELEYVISRAIEKEYDAVLLTGSGSSNIDDGKLKLLGQSIQIIRLNELECVANIVRHEGYSEGLVVNIGTGTSFLYYEDGNFQHVSGTGVGGGMFMGLSNRLLNESNIDAIVDLAKNGRLENVNLVIKDIYNQRLGWLEDDITVANFVKGSQSPEDIALGIHSAIIEPIMSITKGINHFKSMKTIIFTGGVMNNPIIVQLVEKYSKFFNIQFVPFRNPSFGTALGALEVYWNRYHNKNS